jgi:SAM-dependent methyltransferase
LIKKYIKYGELLELGAGGGWFLKEAQKCFKVFAIEPNPGQASFIRNVLRIPCEENVLTTESFNGKEFDIIYHRDVLSHFYDPVAEFLKIKARLKKKGYLIFETGNLGEIDKKHFALFEKFYYPDHLFFFSHKSLRLLLKKTGFKLIRIYSYSTILQLLTGKFLAMIKRKPINMGSDKIKKTPYKPFHFFLSYILCYRCGHLLPKNGYPQTLIVVAKNV